MSEPSRASRSPWAECGLSLAAAAPGAAATSKSAPTHSRYLRMRRYETRERGRRLGGRRRRHKLRLSMGKVVKLDTAATDRPKAKSKPPARRPRPKRSRTALVLGGGGFTGGVYEIGALRALDLLSVNRTVNQFDIYVGTSAGAFVAAAVANGITPEEMMRVIVQQVPTPFPDARVSSLLKPNYGELVTKGILLPYRLAQVARRVIRDVGQISAVDLVVGLAEVL